MEGYSNGYTTTPISYAPPIIVNPDHSKIEQLEAMVEELTINALTEEP